MLMRLLNKPHLETPCHCVCTGHILHSATPIPVRYWSEAFLDMVCLDAISTKHQLAASTHRVASIADSRWFTTAFMDYHGHDMTTCQLLLIRSSLQFLSTGKTLTSEELPNRPPAGAPSGIVDFPMTWLLVLWALLLWVQFTSTWCARYKVVEWRVVQHCLKWLGLSAHDRSCMQLPWVVFWGREEPHWDVTHRWPYWMGLNLVIH